MHFSPSVSILICPSLVLGQRVLALSPTRFTFDEIQCEEGSFHDDDQMSRIVLKRNASSTACSPVVGLSSWMSEPNTSSLTSIGPASTLWSGQSEAIDGISFEVWMMPSATEPDGDRHPIFTIGTRDVNESRPLFAFSPCVQQAFDFQIASYQNQLEIFFRTNDIDFEPCQNYRVSFQKLIPWRLYHVVVSMKDKHQQVFVNGVPSPILAQPFANDLSHWSAQYSIQAFSHTLANATWSGTIYRITVHPGIMDTPQVHELIRNGLPSAEPYAFSHIISINEDAEESPGSHPPEWYARPSPVHEAQRIEIRALSVAHEIYTMQKELNINSTSPVPQVFVYLTDLPSVGSLYTVDGIELTVPQRDTKLLIPVPSESPRFIYKPPLNLFSKSVDDPVAKMMYCVTSAPIFDPVQCDAKEIILYVIPVNDPPLIYTRDPIVIYEGNASSQMIPISFPAVDVDFGDTIIDVQVVQTPKYGDLRLFVTSFRPHGLLDGTPLSIMGFRLGGDPQGRVIYSINPETFKQTPVQGQSLRDSFTYRACDSTGTWSVIASLEIIIVSAVQAISDENFHTEEDSKEQGNIRLRVLDASGYNRHVKIFIESVPSPDHGTIFDPTGAGEILSGGTTLNHTISPPYEAAVALSFIPAPNYCSFDDEEMQIAPPLLVFRGTALDDDGMVVSVSDTETVQLRVLCSTDRVQLTVLNATLETSTIGLRSLSSTGTVGGYVPTPPFAIAEGISMTTVDQKLRDATVVVSTTNGLLTFNSDFWKFAIPVVGRSEFSANEIKFLAQAEDFNYIFKNLQFQSFTPGRDSIELQVLHGRCGSTEGTNVQSVECQVTRGSLPVLVTYNEFLSVRRTKLIDGFPWQLLICIFFYPLAYYCYVEASQYGRRRILRAESEHDLEYGRTQEKEERQR